MITEKDLQEAIAECEGERKPTASTCIKLAAYYTIYDHMYGMEGAEEGQGQYSFAPSPTGASAAEPMVCDIGSGTEFADATRGMDIYEVLDIMDELMSALQVTSPRLYAGVMRRISK